MNEWKATGDLAGRGLGALVRIVGDTHKAVADRVDAALPPVAKPFNAAHMRTAEAVYSVVEAAHTQAPRALGRLSGSPTDTRAGQVLQPVVNGFHGDLLAQEHPELALSMTLRINGRDAVVADYADSTGHVVVYVHGLAEDERAWSLRAAVPYGERLRDLDLTAVYVRYNSGLHISDNGQALAALLDDLVAQWPVPVTSISLVGHSMGGLVARSACHVGGRWTELVKAVVTLGSPHLGAPLEKAVHVVDWVMRRVPETEPMGRILAHRSVGVKDLRFGSLVEDDWRDQDIDVFLANRCAEVPLLPTATYYWVAATLTRDPGHPWGRLVGDGMVRYPSAASLPSEGVHLGGVGHMDLLTDEAVCEALREWLAP